MLLDLLLNLLLRRIRLLRSRIRLLLDLLLNLLLQRIRLLRLNMVLNMLLNMVLIELALVVE
jgi:hypothetical protein